MLSEVESALNSVYQSQTVFLPALAPDNIRALKNSLISSTAIVSSSPIINAIYRDIQEHKYEKLTSKTIADRLSFSSSYISHHFKDITGMTLTEYIHQQKIKEAQYLLDTTNLSLSSISEKLGFSSQQQFQLIFKKILVQRQSNTKTKNINEQSIFS